MIVVNAKFLSNPITGCERFAIEICRELKKILGEQLLLVAPHNIIQTEIAKELGVKIIGVNTRLLWEQFDLPIFLYKQKNPILLNLTNTAPILYNKNLSTIHDIAYERFPKTFSWKFRTVYRLIMPIIARLSKHIFTVSNFSKDEIVDKYNINRTKISVIYNAVDESFKPNLSKKIDKKYVLAVSSLNYRKNFISLIKAFNLIEDNEVFLYIVGSADKNFSNIDLKKEVLLNNRIIFTGRVDDNELIELYSNAICFVYPSIYEGFGIPPLEAQACGCPVAISDVSSLPEVGGESVLYFDPYSVEDIKNKIVNIIYNDNVQLHLREKGFANVKRFNWKKSATDMLEIIERFR